MTIDFYMLLVGALFPIVLVLVLLYILWHSTRAELQALHERVRVLERDAVFKMEPYPVNKGDGEFAVKDVLRSLIQHLGLKLTYLPAKPEQLAISRRDITPDLVAREVLK
jgi:hypothetical protein